jgi:signal transduction histidine kinase
VGGSRFMNPYSFIPLASFFINAILASVVFALNPRGKPNRAYSLFTLDFAGWALLNFIEWNFPRPALLAVCARLEPFFWLPTAFLVLNFIYVLTKKNRDRVFWSFAAIVGAWTVAAVATGCLLEGFERTYWGVATVVTALYYPSVAMSSLLPALYGFYILTRAIKAATDKHYRTQLAYLTAGTLAMFALVFSESVFRNSLLRIVSLPFLGSFFLVIQSGFVFIAIVRHRFLSVGVDDAARAIFSRVRESVLLLDLNHGLIDMNEAAREFFGITDAAGTDSPGRSLELDFLRGENCVNREITISREGRSRIGLLSQSDLFDRERLIGRLVIIHDITRQREEELERHSLESKVQQSHVSRLEALGQLAGGIAHDFNNMLGGIIGYADLLRVGMNGMDRKLVTYAERISVNMRQAADLAKKLLGFARRDVSEMTELDLHETLRDTVSLIEHTISKRIEVKSDLRAVGSMITGDRAQIQNLVLNMAINAGDAMPDGGVLRVNTFGKILSPSEAKGFSEEAAGGEYVVVEVGDTGTGMTEDVKKRIFDPFFTTKEPGKGTGLGLASAYGIAKTHKGFITVESRLGEGSAFFVYFPASARGAAAGKKNQELIENGRGTIIVVDDEEGIRESSTEMLKTMGYAVTPFDNGHSAIAWYKDHVGEVDLALLDVMMPKMTGDQCAEELRRMDPDLRIVFVSGYPGTLSDGKLAALSGTHGPAEIAQKPLSIEQLSKLVKTVLAR